MTALAHMPSTSTFTYDLTHAYMYGAVQAAVLPPSPTPHRELVPNPATHAALMDMEDEGMAIEQIEMNAPSTPLKEEEL